MCFQLKSCDIKYMSTCQIMYKYEIHLYLLCEHGVKSKISMWYSGVVQTPPQVFPTPTLGNQANQNPFSPMIYNSIL